MMEASWGYTVITLDSFCLVDFDFFCLCFGGGFCLFILVFAKES